MLTPKKYRVQLDFLADSFQEIEQLRTDTRAVTRAEVFRHALSLLRFVVREYRAGKQLVVRNPKTQELELVVLPYLEKSRKNRRK